MLDLGKMVAEESGLPCIAIPTTPSTCAAWTAVATTYDDAGVYQGVLELMRGPALLVYDEVLLASAPARLLRAGLADTLAKEREAIVTGTPPPSSGIGAMALEAARHGAEAVRRVGATAVGLAEARNGDGSAPSRTSPWDRPEAAPVEEPSRIAHEAIVLLSGLASGLGGRELDAFAAHPIADALTLASPYRALLHGERVALGLLVQEELLGRGSELAGLRALFDEWRLPSQPPLRFRDLPADLRVAIATRALQPDQALVHRRTVSLEDLEACLSATL